MHFLPISSFKGYFSSPLFMLKHPHRGKENIFDTLRKFALQRVSADFFHSTAGKVNFTLT